MEVKVTVLIFPHQKVSDSYGGNKVLGLLDYRHLKRMSSTNAKFVCFTLNRL